MRRLLALSCAIVLVDTIFYAALTPLVPYFNEEFNLSKAAVGVLSGAYGAGVLVGSAPGAYLASRAGVKAAAVVGLILMSLTSLAFGLVDAAPLLVLARFVGGLGRGLHVAHGARARGAARGADRAHAQRRGLRGAARPRPRERGRDGRAGPRLRRRGRGGSRDLALGRHRGRPRAHREAALLRYAQAGPATPPGDRALADRALSPALLRAHRARAIGTQPARVGRCRGRRGLPGERRLRGRGAPPARALVRPRRLPQTRGGGPSRYRRHPARAAVGREPLDPGPPRPPGQRGLQRHASARHGALLARHREGGDGPGPGLRRHQLRLGLRLRRRPGPGPSPPS